MAPRHLRVLSLALLVLLVAPLPVGDALVLPDEGWLSYLDPLALTPDLHYIARADDGDVGVLYSESTLPSFAFSTSGSGTWSTSQVNATLTSPTNLFVIPVGATDWYAFFISGGAWHVFNSTDDGATWEHRQTVTDAPWEIHPVQYGTRFGVVVVRGTSIEWYRTSNGFVSFDRTGLVLAEDLSDPDLQDAAVVAWDTSNIDVWFTDQLTPISTSSIKRVHSNDGGAFWTGITAVVTDSYSKVDIVGMTNGDTAFFGYKDVLGGNNRFQWWVLSAPGTTGTAGAQFSSGLTCNNDIDRTGAYLGNDVYWYICGGLYILDNANPAGQLAAVAGDPLPGTANGRFSMTGGDYLIASANNAGFSSRYEIHAFAPPPGISPAVTVPVTGLVGFDADPSGTTLIARVNSGPDVVTYAAGTLAASSPLGTNCNRLDGVAALRDYVSLLHCDPVDATDVDQLQIRTSSLAAPTFDACPAGGFCTADLDDEDLAGPQDQQLEITAMDAYPFDYSKTSTSGSNAAYAAWGFSTLDGRVGVMTYVWINNAVDYSAASIATVDPSASPVDQVCTTVDDDGTSYLYAASSESNAKGFRVDFDQQVGGTFDRDPTFDVSLVQVFPGTASTSGPVGVGCGEGRFAVLTPTSVSVWDRGNSTPVWPAITGLTGTSLAGVAMSDDGEWLGYKDNDGVHILAADNGTEVALLIPPAGTFKALALQGAGSTAWIATDQNIARYDIFTATTGQDTAYDPTPVPPPTDPTVADTDVGGALLGESINRASQESGLSSTAVGALLALIGVIVAASLAAVGLGLALGIWGGVVGFFAGATAGVITAHYLGLLEPWVIAFLVFMALLLIVVMVTAAMRRG